MQSKHSVSLCRSFRMMVLAWAGLLPATAAWATTGSVTLTPTADARVQQANTKTNYGSAYLATVGGTGKQLQTYLQFNVSGAAFPLATAKLRLYATTATTDGPAVYKTASTWTETALTWSNAPAISGSASDDKAAIVKNTWVEFDVKALVAANGAIAFNLQQPGTTEVDFQSREQTNRPQLVLTWDTACTGKAEGASCNDGSACTSADVCRAGVCTGTAVNCNDANACTTDSCNMTSGCQHVAVSGSCDLDASVCTADSCVAGICSAGPATVCNDKDPCTADTCSPTSGGCVYTPIAGCQNDVLVARGAVWRYLANGTTPASTWTTTAFSDSAWPAGYGELGYGLTGQTTTIPYGSSASAKYITTYFRHSFNVTNPANYPAVAISCKANDGVIVYLNGTEIYRNDMAYGAVTGTQTANSINTDLTYQIAYINPALLLTGSNVIAAEVHQVSGSSPDLAFDLDLTRKCPLLIGDPANEAVESKCDGLDNDCDGLTDVLLPIATNACTTGAPGTCGSGFATCSGGVKTCLTPPPIAETSDGKDNDCNGITDDAVAGSATPIRVKVMLGWNMGSDAPAVNAAAVEMLGVVGAPFYTTNTTTATVIDDFNNGFTNLDQYSLILMPGYLIGLQLSQTQLMALQTWVQGGGILVWVKPSMTPLLNFAGITDTAQHLDGDHIDVTANVPGALYLDSLEERNIHVSNNPTISPTEVFTYTLDPTSGATAFGNLKYNQTNLGPAMVRLPMGAGAIYTLGFDPLGYKDPRCYVNCFDPGRDIGAQLLRAILRESTHGHYAVKHPVPGVQDGVVVLTHDVDAPDAYNTDPSWGTAGALQMATMETGKGVRSTYFMTSDYVANYWNASVVTALCNLGVCPQGGHSVQHLNMTSLPLGDCTVTKANYVPSSPTECGETVVNLQILQAALPAGQPKVQAWRAPYLGVHVNAYDVLAAQGVQYDASWGLGDIQTNAIVSVARFPSAQWKFHAQPMWMFPLILEDGIGGVDSSGATTRVELQRANERWFLTNWTYVTLNNAANHMVTTQLVHPSYGLGVGPENLAIKVEAVGKFVDKIKPLSVLLEQVVSMGDFWKARDPVALVVNYDPVTGYSGTVTTGVLPASRLVLEFGDNIKTFAMGGLSASTIVNNRVALGSTLAANTTYSFTAKP